jgi:signal transduction histidine kinase/DNA-binding response OmpR family regulator
MTDETINILIVDDMPDKRLALRTALEGVGDEVVAAESGREALRLLLTRDFAVILLDVYMPDIDGFETATLIRQRPRSEHTPIIFITGHGDEVQAIQGYSIGAVDYILSPVVPQVLRTKVGVFVDLYRKTLQVRKQARQEVELAHEQAARAAAEEATRRTGFLAEAGNLLVTSMDLPSRVEALLRLAVPQLSDLAAVTLAGEIGPGWRTDFAWCRPPDPAVLTGTLSAPEAPDDALRAAVERVLDGGPTQRLAGPPVPLPPALGGPPVVLHGAVVLPMRKNDGVLGALTLASADPGRRLDLALAQDLASRAAIALHNARLYRDIQEGNRRKDEFLAMLAHELRNPLAPIRNAAQLLRMAGPSESEREWALDVIDRQAGHLARLVDDLLDVARITRGKINFQPVLADASVVAASAIETSGPLIRSRGHELSIDLPDERLWVTADPTRLAQVLSNLLNNAAKYTPEGGRVELSVAAEAGRVVFAVRDTGVGIPHDMLGGIFDLFTQVDRTLDRAQGGLGIGLTLVKRLVELHGGVVEAASEGPGRGSTFYVRLPAAEAPARPAHAGTAVNGSPPLQAGRLQVLLVDDNRDAADALAALLRATGYKVEVFHDGPSALRAIAGALPDVVLLDIGLPGMDGYEIARAIRRMPGADGTLIVAVTGYGQEDDYDRSRDAGFDDHLVKPVDPDALMGLLAGHARAGESPRRRQHRPARSGVSPS